MEKIHTKIVNKFKALPKTQKILIIIVSVILLTLANKNDKSKLHSASQSSTHHYESQSANCDYCSKSFYKNSGVKLSGHSEVFCGTTCATNWGWQHNIGVN